MFLKVDRRAEFRWKYYSYNDAESPEILTVTMLNVISLCGWTCYGQVTKDIQHICEDADPGFNSLNWFQVCKQISFDMVSHVGPDFSKALKQRKIP